MFAAQLFSATESLGEVIARTWGKWKVIVPAFVMPRKLADKASASSEDGVSLDDSSLMETLC